MADSAATSVPGSPAPECAPPSLERDGRAPDRRLLATLRDQNVLSQWNSIRALETLAFDRAAEVQETCSGLAALIDNDPLVPLKPWPGLAPEHHQAYQRTHNQARVRRLLNYIMPEDRLLDIGCGFGYVSGVLLRDTALSYYCGIDIGSHRIQAAHEMLAANGLTHKPSHFETRDLFRIDADFMRQHQPTLIVMCEVLEHLADPVEALGSVVRPAPDDAAILFSVPMAGRLEDVKGHVSFFNVDRLIYLCRRAGLVVQYAEPICNRWIYVLASRCENVLPRVVQLSRKTLDAAPPPQLSAVSFSERTTAGSASAADTPPVPSKFVPVRFSKRPREHLSWWKHRTERVEVAEAGTGLQCTIVGSSDDSAGQYGGVKFAAKAPRGVRLDLSILNPEHVLSVHVAGYADRRSAAAVQWVWRAKRDTPIPPARREHTLVPGVRSRHFVPHGDANSEAVNELHVFLRISPGSNAGFILHGAEIVP